ncbi:MAG: penicillin-binding protein activator [Alphaproteobacteria bacterium]|nr:penicillin-binding protein activator [Alphaproteobacteria bacterium]
MALSVAACGGPPQPQVKAPVKTEVQTAQAKPAEDPAPSSSVQPPAVAEDEEAEVNISITTADPDDAGLDEPSIQAIIDQLKKADAQTSDDKPFSSGITSKLITPEDSGSTVVWTMETKADPKAPEAEAVIPEGEDPSLAADALAAAFALVRQSTTINDQLIQDKDTPMVNVSKPEGAIRAAMLLPLSGPAQAIGDDMRHGAELAIFTLSNPEIDLTFHNTASGVEKAMTDAITQNADVVIGPLFAGNTKAAQSIASFADIPVLSFSNDRTVAGNGAWLIGQTPEQEIETVLWQALNTLSPIEASGREQLSIAIIAQSNEYGSRISQHAIDIMRQRGGLTAELLTLDETVLADEKALRASVKTLTKWLPPASDGSTRVADFDIVLIAGDARFSLRIAPVLNWYDLDPQLVQYLGTSAWDNPAILQEPSLMGGWFAHLPSRQLDGFSPIWSAAHQGRASKYAVMAFDAVALISTLDRSSPIDRRASLTGDLGFSGFSGMFKFNPDGSTTRLLEIRRITANGHDVIVPASSRF